MAVFVGTWERVKSENMKEYLTSIGLPEDLLKTEMEKKEIYTVGRDGDKWTTRYIAGDLEESASFTVGEPTEFKTILGTMCKGTILSVDDNKMTETYSIQEPSPIVMDVVRVMEGNQMVITTTTNGVSCKAWLERK